MVNRVIGSLMFFLTPLPWQMIFAWYIPCGRITHNHDNALYKIHSGRLFMGYPTLGSWVVYGLGSENANLPAYVVLSDPLGLPKNGTRNWTAGFLPPVYQGTQFRPQGSPILNLSRDNMNNRKGPLEEAETLLNQLDMIHKENRPFQPELDARIQSYELASRMQLAASEALDLDHESLKTHEMYGIGQSVTDSFGRRCLLARRLVERGVRYVQIFLEEQPWDSHVDLASNHPGGLSTDGSSRRRFAKGSLAQAC